MRRILRVLVWISLMNGMPLLSHAQSEIPAKIEHYSTEDGLSHDVISTMFKDREGYMWFGTWGGLNRFDGVHFYSFKSVAGDSSQIGNNRIDHIDEDGSGQLWIKAYDGQIYRFNKATEKFKSLAVILKLSPKISFERVLLIDNREMWVEVSGGGIIYIPDVDEIPNQYTWFKSTSKAENRLPSDKITFLLKDHRGQIWIGTNKRLVHLVQAAHNKYIISNNGIQKTAGLSFSSFVEASDDIYFGTEEGVLWNLKKKTNLLTSMQLEAGRLNNILISNDATKLYVTTASGNLIVINRQNLAQSRYHSPNNAALHSMFEDKKGNIWIEPDKKGVLRFDKKGYFEAYSQNNDSKNINAGNHFKVFEDKNGVVWCVLRDGGFGYYDSNSNSLRYFHNEPGGKDHAFSNLVTVAYCDPTGVMWLHTDEHGIEKVIIQPRTFEQHLVKESTFFQSDNEIRSLCVDRMNRVWICSKAGKVYWLSNGKLTLANFRNLPSANIGGVYATQEDDEGNLWLGTKTNGLFEAIPEDSRHTAYRLINFLHNEKDPNSVSSNQIYSIKEDKNGQIWIGTFDHGLNAVIKNKGNISFSRISSQKDGYPKGFDKIRVIETDRNDNLWIGTTKGLVIMNRTGGRMLFNKYQKSPGDAGSLGNNDIQFIHCDSYGRMWLATSGGGLDMAVGMPGKTALRFDNYTVKLGLASDYVLSCTEDKLNHLWLATKSGLSMFDLNTKKIKNFNSYDGLSTAGFSEGTCQRTLDGKLIFGMIRGYLIFDPDKVMPHPIKGNLVFTDLRINTERIRIGDSSNILKQNINYSGGLVLHHDQNAFSIDYSMLDYRFDGRLPFRYRLKGLETYWHDNANQLRASYTNLSAGNYLFEVECVDPDRYINAPYKSLAITILPAPWLTWWAYLIYGAIALAIGLILWRNTLTALKLKQEIAVEHQLTELKLNFFTNISHELRTPLMLILNPIAHLIRHENSDPTHRQYLNIVDRNAKRMVRFVNQLLDFRKLQHGKTELVLSQFEITAFIRNIIAHFDDVCEQKEIEVKLEGLDEPLYVALDHDKVETVIYNLLSNAFKFTPEKRAITITLNRNISKKELSINVKDEGYGVPDDELGAIFELYHSDQRQTVKNSKGTGIGLALSKELIMLHGGKITAQNAPNGGLLVKVELPLTDINERTAITAPAPGPNEAVAAMPVITEIKGQRSDLHLPLLVLVEDNADMREFLKLQLMENYRVMTAADGAEGLDLIKVMMPDIVLSDVMMPRMNGIELIDHLKNDPAVSHIPVVLMSARSAVEHQIVGLNYGADYYLSKPFRNELLLAAIANILEQRRKLFEKLSANKKIVNLAPGDIIVTSKDEAFINNVMAIIEKNMADPDFDIEMVAQMVNMGRANFYKKFKSLTQIAPVEFVRDIRLQRAKQYFDAGSGNVAEIAYTVGFSSPKYFSTCFRTKYNIAPSDYIKSSRIPVNE